MLVVSTRLISPAPSNPQVVLYKTGKVYLTVLQRSLILAFAAPGSIKAIILVTTAVAPVPLYDAIAGGLFLWVMLGAHAILCSTYQPPKYRQTGLTLCHTADNWRRLWARLLG